MLWLQYVITLLYLEQIVLNVRTGINFSNAKQLMAAAMTMIMEAKFVKGRTTYSCYSKTCAT
jgi:hypothetical protein